MRRAASSLSEELKRNKVKGKYDPEKAHHKAYVRRLYAKYQGMKIARNARLQEFVENELYDDQSPEAISGFLKQQKRQSFISKNSIYRYIASPYGRRIEYHRDKVKRRGKHKKPRSKPWKDRVFIDKRPRKILLRRGVGHMEGDFIVSGKSGKGVLLVIVDRKLRISLLEQILNPDCRAVTRACMRIKRRYPGWQTLTTDNDLLFQHHKELERRLDIKIYFCFPGHMWEKPSVENANKWLRKYIPKSSDISRYSKHFIRRLEEKINRRILKVLSFQRPEILLKEFRKRRKRRSVLGG